MLDFQSVQQQMNDFGAYRIQYKKEEEKSLQEALTVFDALKNSAQNWEYPLHRDFSDKLMAIPLHAHPSVSERPASEQSAQSSPLEWFLAPKRPPSITVVATDGSQIYPDRHFEPLCYLLNVSRIVFHYGTLEKPILDSVPKLYFRGRWFDDETVEITGPDIVSAFRDIEELRVLWETASAERISGRPILAMADGTLIRWMVRRLQNPEVEEKLLKQYTDLLDLFWRDRLPVCSYISLPANKELIRLMMHQVAASAQEREERIASLHDRLLLQHVLPVGMRTAVFQSQSKVLEQYGDQGQVCYFYVHVRAGDHNSEVVRVEFPKWITDREAWIQRIHAVVLSETEKGRGYPMILSEAHEHAVVRAQERTMFYDMMERVSLGDGYAPVYSMKKRSKEQAFL